MKRKNRTLAVCLLLSAVLAGCSKKEQPAPPPPKKEAQPAKPPVHPATPPVQQQASSAVKGGMRMDFSRRVDPFKPYAPVVAPPPVTASQQSAVPQADLLPIQSFEVSKFKVVGIIAGFKENKALVIDPNGKGYVVQEGMQIGNNNGRITKITANSIEVVERFREGSGRVRQRKTVLTLAKKR